MAPLCTNATAAGDADEFERFLVTLFLRRYVTYCVRRRRFNAALDAAALFRRIATR